MTHIEHVVAVTDGILLYFKDGREAILSEESVIHLAETSHAFEVLLYRLYLAELSERDEQGDVSPEDDLSSA